MSHEIQHTRCGRTTLSVKMKLLVLVCLIGFAAASFLEQAAPAVDDAILAFLKGTSEGKSLREALGSDDPMFDDVEDDIKTGLGKTLKEALEEFLKKIKDSMDNGKEISEKIKEKVKDIRQKLKDLKEDLSDNAKELLKKIKEKAKELLKSLLDKLGNVETRNLDHQMDSVARMKFFDLIEKIREKLLSDETIQKIRDYIRKLETENPIVQRLKELVEKLRDVDLKEIIRRFFEHKTGRNIREVEGSIWERIKNFFKELGVKIDAHFKNFGKWVKDMWGQGIEKLKEKHGAIKAIAMEFISHAKDVSAEVAREALEFLRPYKDDLGSLWQKIVDAAKEAIGRF